MTEPNANLNRRRVPPGRRGRLDAGHDAARPRPCRPGEECRGHSPATAGPDRRESDHDRPGRASTRPCRRQEKDAIRLIQRAVDEGITFLDNAWDYTTARPRSGWARHLAGRPARQGLPHDQGLRPHRQGRPVEPRGQPPPAQDRPYRPLAVPRDRLRQRPRLGLRRGRRARVRAQGSRTGKVRYLGFTGHKDPAIHLKMLAKPYEWASVQMPLNVHGRPLPELPEAGPARAHSGASHPSA